MKFDVIASDVLLERFEELGQIGIYIIEGEMESCRGELAQALRMHMEPRSARRERRDTRKRDTSNETIFMCETQTII